MTSFLCLAICLISHADSVSQQKDTLKIKHTADFEIKGDGSSSNWNNSEWQELLKNDVIVSYKTKIRMLYSDAGIYCLYHCEDNRITATLRGDFLDLWNEDVVEAFF